MNAPTFPPLSQINNFMTDKGKSKCSPPPLKVDT